MKQYSKGNSGFTLIELMITVAIISVTMSIGLPSFQSLINESRLTSAANAMLSAYQLARFEALKMHRDVSVTTADEWATWKVTYIDISVTPNVTKTVATFEAPKNIIIKKEGGVTGYGANGRQNDGSGCDITDSLTPACGFTFKNADGTQKRALNIAPTGKLKVSTL